jgi:BirA family transcriptional regulator, biotin operon repressor / biotin---[acetyl-CoA-carboxylase] ligase
LYNAIYDLLIIAKNVIYLPSCHSTNDIAAELVRSGLFQDGTVVITNDQTRGRGQRGTTWVTEPNVNLTFSIALKPQFLPVRDQFLVSQAMSVGICNYLEGYSSTARIKWPNDVFLGDLKVSGMLIENSIQGNRIASCIVGIGVNINQSNFSTARATSLSSYLGMVLSLEDEFPKLMHCLDAAYLRLKSAEGRIYLEQEYLRKLYGFDQRRAFIVDEIRKTGKISGISAQGRLRIIFDGETEPTEFNHKEVEWWWD